MKLVLIFKDIADEFVRENFDRITEWTKDLAILKPKWKFFEVALAAGNVRFLHRLGFRPKDIILLSVTKSESVIFHYDDFTKDHLSLTASGACTVRFFAGSYTEKV